MSTKNNINDLSDKEIDALFKKEGLFDEIDYGIITDGLCETPEAQDEFDAKQKGKPPQEFYE